MASLISGYEYDIFISYRQKDNKHDGWVTEFVNQLKGELESTFKEDIRVYFDINPHDGLLETHDVNASLKEKLKCLIFIPIISRTYCDPKSFAWEHEFCSFNKLAKEDQFGRDIKLLSGNVASRILPIKIHDLDPEDKALLENELGGFLRSIEFIYKEPGVNRPLKPEDEDKKNLNGTKYLNQINKVANSVKEIINVLKKQSQQSGEAVKQDFEVKTSRKMNRKITIIITSAILLAMIALGYFLIPKLIKSSSQVEKSIAVLPFLNLSNDPEQEYFSDGMVDEILDRLYKVGDLKVISRTSSMRFKNTKLTLKEIAHELDVSAILEGSVRKIGKNVRITVQLIDTKTDNHLWSEIYDRELSDVFAIQSEVAQNVARKLKATITSKETILIQRAIPTTSQRAYDFYLRGNDYFSKYKPSLALDMYSKAIQEDSLFTAAYARRARTHIFLYWVKYVEGWQGHDIKAQEDIKKGIQLNPELPELKISQAAYHYQVNRDYDKALRILNELKAEAPNMADLYAYSSSILRRQGKWEESISERKIAIKLDPLNAEYYYNLSETYQLLHQFDNLIECSKKGLSLIPDYTSYKYFIFKGFLSINADLKVALKESGLKEEEVQYEFFYYSKQYGKLFEYIQHNITLKSDQFDYHPKTFELALSYYLSDNKSLCKIYADSAITYLKGKINEIPDDDRFYATLGKCYAFRGNTNEAITCGKKAVNLKPVKFDAWQGVKKEQDLMEIYVLTGNYELALDKIEYLLSIPSELSIGYLLIDPIYDNLRSLPRFQKIIDSAQKKLAVK